MTVGYHHHTSAWFLLSPTDTPPIVACTTGMCFESWACKSPPFAQLKTPQPRNLQQDPPDDASYSNVERWLCGRDWQVTQGGMELDRLKRCQNQFQKFKHTMGLSCIVYFNVAACSLQRTNSWGALLVVSQHDTLFRWQNGCTSWGDSRGMCKHDARIGIGHQKHGDRVKFWPNFLSRTESVQCLQCVGRSQKLNPNETLNTPVYQNSSIHIWTLTLQPMAWCNCNVQATLHCSS